MPDNIVEITQGAAAAQRDGLVPLDPNKICDARFMEDVEQLKKLRSYMIRQAKISEAGTIELGNLNLLRLHPDGRFPTAIEWSDLEHRSNQLYQRLPEQERRRFLYSQIPDSVIKTATMLGGVALLSLILHVGASLLLQSFPSLNNPIHFAVFLAFFTWAGALGGIGSIAFIGMNALAVQEDATFDITNEKLIRLRVILGVLFGVVLTLPVGFPAFYEFAFHSRTKEETSSAAVNSALFVLPFILGFSTSLVIMILNQFVEAVQSFFGKKSTPPPAAAAPIAPHPPAQVIAPPPPGTGPVSPSKT